MRFLFVALGGAIGASARYALSLLLAGSSFPLNTLLINIAGAILLGFFSGLLAQSNHVSINTVLFLTTGICGGFTTFSTFSLEAFNLLENNEQFQAVLYIVLSVVGCLLGIPFGRKIALILF